jgi:endogenous inhibitor of DNA gyrase (YacG/DUF329 family)
VRGHLSDPISRECKGCGASYTTTVARKLFCSEGCKSRHYDRLRTADGRREVEHVCDHCGQQFHARRGRKFCSYSCSALAKWASSSYEFPTGPDHPNWRGGSLASRRRRDYGIEPEQYEALLVAQNSVCAICKNNRSARPLGVDHNHTTGAVRGLLCGPCNAGLGLFGDNPGWLLAAVSYLGAADGRDTSLTALSEERDQVTPGDPPLAGAAP